MKQYNITFAKYYEYTVEADSDPEAVAKAEKQLDRDQSYPVCLKGYDYCNIECLDEEDEE